MHEAPEIPNYVEPRMGRPRFLRGMTIAVEPMVNAGSAAIKQMPDGWTVKTADARMPPTMKLTPDHRRRAGASDGPGEIVGVRWT